MKYVPNTLSLLRLSMAIPLIIFAPFTFPFMVAYVIAVISDLLDGPIARKFNVTSPLGATIDSIADVTIALLIIFRILPLLEVSTWILVWIGIAIAMKFLGAFIGFVRYQRLVLLHSYANKFFILILCFFPVFYLFLSANVILIGMLSIAMVAFCEDIYINSTSTELDLDVKGVFFK